VWKTYGANRKTFNKWAIIPRMLRNCTARNLETTIFGHKFKAPMLLAPIGVQGILHPDAEIATATAAKETNIPMILSTAATRSMEEVAEVHGDGHRWYQLYWPYSDEITVSLLNRAKKSGYSALIITLDTMSIGWRPHDLDTAYLPFFHSYGCQNGFADPVFMARYGKQPEPRGKPAFPYNPQEINARAEQGDPTAKAMMYMGTEWVREMSSGRQRSWDELKLLKDNWDGPLVLKGVQCAADAELAIDAGVDGIVVSNHGGRQVDGAVSALWSLEHIMKSAKVREAQASGKFTVLFDPLLGLDRMFSRRWRWVLKLFCWDGHMCMVSPSGELMVSNMSSRRFLRSLRLLWASADTRALMNSEARPRRCLREWSDG